jgi:tetratricopeptide (TPR) repeat protein
MNAKRNERGKTTGAWDQVRDLYYQLLSYLYRKGDVKKARSYADQIERLLPKVDPEHKAIFGEECWSLVYEAKDQLDKAIKHRKREIELIRRLQAVSRGQPYEKEVTEGYDVSDLSDRLNLLASLYQENGDLDKALRTLDESKRLCAKHGITFDGEDLLRDLKGRISPTSPART